MIRNKNVLITGASSGIGEALAVYYAQNGAANLFICGRNAERLAKVREACERYGAKVSAEVLDVTQREAVKNWVERCNVPANLNVVIANAGTGTINETEEAVLNTFNTNVKAMNTVLHGRGGGRNGFAQGSVEAERSAIESFFKENGYGICD